MISDIELSIPQSLTPDSSNEDTQSEEASTPKLSKENHDDALTIVAQDSLIEPSTVIKEIPLKWCQRCGTLETPRWRYGPGGLQTLCNACHLAWKIKGKPIEGYTSPVFPPTHLVVKRKPHIKTLKKQKLSSSTKNKVLCDNRIPRNQHPIIQQEKENKPSCTQCQTIDTPLWRRGPMGPRTLCNACGLKWAKTTSATEKKTAGVTEKRTVTPAKTEHKTKKESTPSKKKYQDVLLFHRKEFVKRGLYYDATRLTKPSRFSFDLPLYQGEYIISKETAFELPPYIHQERELGLIKSASAMRVPFFVRIRSNIFVERKPQTGQRDPLICVCKRPPPGQRGCGEDCINRLMFYECDPKHCPCGDQCSNQRFQRKERKKALEVYHTEQRGWGLRTLTDIQKGELVIEYRGEIISQKLCEERMCHDYVNEKNFYFLDYQNGEVIDATTKGTEARFINHSCEPNCHIEKWSCRGESNFGVFASTFIKANSELFYDYNFSTFNGSVESHQLCYCGSQHCRGLIGRKVRVSK